MTNDDVTLLTNTMEINHATDDRENFKDTIHMVPQWRLTVPIIVKYLINIYASVSKWKIHYTTVTSTVANHDIIECAHPKLVSLAIGSAVMLPRNYSVEQCLVYGWLVVS